MKTDKDGRMLMNRSSPHPESRTQRPVERKRPPEMRVNQESIPLKCPNRLVCGKRRDTDDGDEDIRQFHDFLSLKVYSEWLAYCLRMSL